jgi:hypothetical protein
MAKKKSSSTRTPPAPAQREEAPVPNRDIRHAVDEASNTLAICDDVLAFVGELHTRKPSCEMEDEIESGEAYILGHVRDLVRGARRTLESVLDRPSIAEADHA